MGNLLYHHIVRTFIYRPMSYPFISMGIRLCYLVFNHPSDAGILRDKTMNDTFMYILNDNKQKYPCCRFKLLADEKLKV